MRRSVWIFCAVGVAAMAALIALPGKPPTLKVEDAIDAKAFGESLGKDWMPVRAIVVDEGDSLDKYTDEGERKNIEAAHKAATAEGVVAWGEFALVRTTFPLNSIELHVMRFTSADAADRWRKKKYEDEQVVKLYKRTEVDHVIVYDSLEMKKRIVIDGPWLITAGHIGQDDIHLVALKAAIKLR